MVNLFFQSLLRAPVDFPHKIIRWLICVFFSVSKLTGNGNLWNENVRGRIEKKKRMVLSNKNPYTLFFPTSHLKKSDNTCLGVNHVMLFHTIWKLWVKIKLMYVLIFWRKALTHLSISVDFVDKKVERKLRGSSPTKLKIPKQGLRLNLGEITLCFFSPLQLEIVGEKFIHLCSHFLEKRVDTVSMISEICWKKSWEKTTKNFTHKVENTETKSGGGEKKQHQKLRGGDRN